MLSWITLTIALIAWFSASIAFCLALYVYLKGPRWKEYEIDDLYEALLEQNDADVVLERTLRTNNGRIDCHR